MTSNNHKHPEILIVDDAFINRMLLTDICTSIGCKCSAARNGEEALRACNEHDFDMVFLDIEMPVKNGFETATAIRALEGAKSQAPIIALTAHNADEINDELTEAGFTDIISKPFHISKIERLVAEYCTAAL